MGGYGEPVRVPQLWPGRADRSTLTRLRRYIRHNVLATLAVVVGVVLLSQFDEPPGAVRSAVLFCGLLGASVLHWNWTGRLVVGERQLMPWWQAALVLTGVLVLVGVGVSGPASGVIWCLLAGLVGHDLLIGRFPTAGLRFTVPYAILVGLVVVVVRLAGGAGAEDSWRNAGLAAAIVLLMLYATVLMVRQWHITVELEHARRAATELATTKERLRLAEDLHDILGHALEVVSLKAELASRLSEVDPERSRAELAEVQRLARGAMHDVRALVAGDRSTAFAIELAGVRGLLDSAGIELEFRGDPAALGAAASELLGRVLREAVTNLLRHAHATHARVSLDVVDGKGILVVRNDGVAPLAGASAAGSGLRGLERRTVEAGGTFSAGVVDGTGEFEVRAEVAG